MLKAPMKMRIVQQMCSLLCTDHFTKMAFLYDIGNLFALKQH